jgi:uncharacterized RDD family membrane protein YckC
VERTIDVATGESVAFSYEQAGLGSRFFAVFIDLAIQIGVLIVAFLLLAWIGSAVPTPPKIGPTGFDKSIQKFATALVEGTGVFALFMLFFGYFILFEWRWGGRTPGKRLLGIRVVRDGGFPVDFTSSVVRNVVRILEAGLGFYAVSAIVTLLSPLNQRLGDMAGGTLVVRDERYERPAAILARAAAADDPVVRDLAETERDLIRRYAARRTALSPQARTKLAATIAAGVRPKLAASYAHLDDDALLQFLAEHALA